MPREIDPRDCEGGFYEQDTYAIHSAAYVKACEDQRTAARIYAQFVRDGLPLFGEPYRIEAEFFGQQIWLHLNWLRENGHDRAYKPRVA